MVSGMVVVVARVLCNTGWKAELFTGKRCIYQYKIRVCVRATERENTRVRKPKYGDMNKELYDPPTR